MKNHQNNTTVDSKSLSQQGNTFFQQAIAAFQQGDLAEAEMLANKILGLNLIHADTYHLLGIIAGQRGQYDQAVQFITRAIKNNPEKTTYYHTYAFALQQGGWLEEAVKACERAIELSPNIAQTYNVLGYARKGLGHLKEAEVACEKAVTLNPNFFEAHNNLGNILQAQGKVNQAFVCFLRTVSLKPDYVEGLNNLGLLYQHQGKLDRALDCFLKALSIKPDYAQIHNNLGNVYQVDGESDLALECYRKALTIQPDYAEALGNYGVVLWEMGRLSEAHSSLQRALELKPDYFEAYYNLGNVLREKGDRNQALDHYRQAIYLNTYYDEARWSYVMTQIPLFYRPEDEFSQSRSDFLHELKELCAWFDSTKQESAYKVVGSATPFYLAYQEENNRDLLSKYGALCARLMGDWQKEQDLAPIDKEVGKRVRLGIVSAHINEHSVWNALVKGWFKHFNRERLELHVFHIGSKQDEETAWAREQSASFSQGAVGLQDWVDVILDKQLDVLIYPEIGMDAMTVKLASMRLAQVQMVAWGHPETSGLPTIDYYLSAEDFEPPAAQEYYTEKLVSIPHLGCCYHPLVVNETKPDISGLGIDPESPILICPGTPFKYVNRHDEVFIAIARRLGHCQFVFFKDDTSELSVKLQQRLEYAFSRAGLHFHDYVIFIPWQEKSMFYGLLKEANIFLDTLGFSGFNTAMQAVECGLPVVTLEGRFMRGRLAAGIMRRMGLSDMVAESQEKYINMVVKLVKDDDYNNLIRQRIEANRYVLFDDMAPVQAMEDFVCSVVKGVA